MTCIHDYVVTYRMMEGEMEGGPIMWACHDCLEKFVPMSQLLAEVSAEREACADILKRNADACVSDSMLHGALMSNAVAILARGNNDFA